GLGGNKFFGVGQVGHDLLVFEVRFDLLGEATVFFGRARETGAIADDGRVGKLAFEVVITSQRLLEDWPHGEKSLPGSDEEVRRATDPRHRPSTASGNAWESPVKTDAYP